MNSPYSKRPPIQRVDKFLMFILLVMMVGSINGCVKPENNQQFERIQQKANLAKQGVKEWNRSGRDISQLLILMAQIKPNLDNSKFDEAESLLDEVLMALETGISPVAKNQSASANITNEFLGPEKVNIIGYSEDAMEPFISRDGRYLFFNNLNDPQVNTNIYYAEKIDDLNFEFKGEVKGINTDALEGVPTLDENNKFCFVSTREFMETRLTLFCGDFKDGSITGLHSIGQSLPKKKGLWLSMGPELSPDGETLFYTEANLNPKTGIPNSLNIFLAKYENGSYFKIFNSDEIMRNINTEALEYAPAISSDGLELLFTRASELIVGNQSAGKNLNILIAKRKNINDPFGEPKEISSIKGFVEGPTVINNGNTVYYHNRDNSRFRIFRVIRGN